MADGYLVLTPIFIVGVVLIFVRLRLKRESRKHKRRPFSDDELRSQFEKLEIENQELFYDRFLRERFGVGKEELFSGVYDTHLKQIVDFDSKQRETGETYPLHPNLIKEVEQQISRSIQEEAR